MGFLDNLLEKVGPDGAFPYGRKMIQRRRYDEALDAFTQAERQYATRFGPRHPRTVDAMAQRAFCLIALNRVGEGLSLYESALAAKVANGDAVRPTVTDLERLVADAKSRESAN